jgi:hypothetical protein
MWQRHRKALIGVGLVVSVVLWWLFRPEALFTKRPVNETAPTDVAALQPLFTGSLHASASIQMTGRVNVVKPHDYLELEISNLESLVPGPFTVALAAEKESAQTLVLGTVTAGGHERLRIPGDQSPDLPRTVLLMDNSHQVLATAMLEPF